MNDEMDALRLRMIRQTEGVSSALPRCAGSVPGGTETAGASFDRPGTSRGSHTSRIENILSGSLAGELVMTAMTSDRELLAHYVRDRSQDAFGELVARHIDMVFVSAHRQLHDAELAEDVTQAVFLMLARKAAGLRKDVVLPAWLLTGTWYACKNAMRQQRRRRIHESRVAAMRSESSDGSAAIAESEVVQALDAALAHLGEADRGAITMRYLQSRSVREVAASLGVSEEAAQKRVTRAIAKLRDYFRRRGVMVEAGTLAGGLSRQAALCAPAALPAVVLATVTSGMTGASASAAAVALADVTAKSMSTAAGAKLVAVGTAVLAAIAIVPVVVLCDDVGLARRPRQSRVVAVRGGDNETSRPVRWC
jgi:RNA polymerase sigma factor (sigma-70 family)